jgi:methyltransferase
MLSPLVMGVAALAAQRLAEVAHSRSNERRLSNRGAVEIGSRHYPMIVALHTCWLAATLVEGRRRPGGHARGWNDSVNRGPLLIMFAAQGLRHWAIRSLGPQWTTRIMVDPTLPPVTAGPYRYLRHPNYLAVATEIMAFPLVFGARRTSLVFSLLNAVALRHRITVEDRGRRRILGHDGPTVCPTPPVEPAEGAGTDR